MDHIDLLYGIRIKEGSPDATVVARLDERTQMILAEYRPVFEGREKSGVFLVDAEVDFYLGVLVPQEGRTGKGLLAEDYRRFDSAIRGICNDLGFEDYPIDFYFLKGSREIKKPADARPSFPSPYQDRRNHDRCWYGTPEHRELPERTQLDKMTCCFNVTERKLYQTELDLYRWNLRSIDIIRPLPFTLHPARSGEWGNWKAETRLGRSLFWQQREDGFIYPEDALLALAERIAYFLHQRIDYQNGGFWSYYTPEADFMNTHFKRLDQ